MHQPKHPKRALADLPPADMRRGLYLWLVATLTALKDLDPSHTTDADKQVLLNAFQGASVTPTDSELTTYVNLVHANYGALVMVRGALMGIAPFDEWSGPDGHPKVQELDQVFVSTTSALKR